MYSALICNSQFIIIPCGSFSFLFSFSHIKNKDKHKNALFLGNDAGILSVIDVMKLHYKRVKVILHINMHQDYFFRKLVDSYGENIIKELHLYEDAASYVWDNSSRDWIFYQYKDIKKYLYMWGDMKKMCPDKDPLRRCAAIKNIQDQAEIREINFTKLYEKKIKSNINYYVFKNNLIKKYKVIYAIPTSILSIDFEGNKRYFYKSSPKYLEINKILHLLNTDSNNALLSVDTFPYLQGNFYLNQNNFSFDKHTVIMGSSGSGKSKFISLLINNIYKNKNLKQKYKVVVIDPHAALENDIGGIGKVIDFNSNLDSIDLFINKNDDIVSSTELLLDLLKSLVFVVVLFYYL